MNAMRLSYCNYLRLVRKTNYRSGLFWFSIFILLVMILAKPLSVLSIDRYQRHISPYKGYRCAYGSLYGGMSCSTFGKYAISNHGVIHVITLLKTRFNECEKASIIRNYSAPVAKS